jgi:hypothetical protein
LAAAEALAVPKAAALAISLAAVLAPASGPLVRAAREAAALLEAQTEAQAAAQLAQIPAAKSAKALELTWLLLIRALSNCDITLGGGRRDFVTRARIPIATLANKLFGTVRRYQKLFWDGLLPILRGREQFLAAIDCPAERDKAIGPLLRPLMRFLEMALRSVLEDMLARAGCRGSGLLRKLRPLKVSDNDSDGYFEFEFDLQYEGAPPEVLQASAVPPGARPGHQIPDCLGRFEWYCRHPSPWEWIVDVAVALLASITRDCPHGPRWGLWTGCFSGPTPCADCAAEKIPGPPRKRKASGKFL